MQCTDVLTYGLDDAKLSTIASVMPSKQCRIYHADCFTDLIATAAFAIIVDVTQTSAADLATLFDFYAEIGDFSETVILIGTATVPIGLTGKIKCFSDFDEMADNVKYLLLAAHRRQKKSENFSATLSNAILILSHIRNTPGISTRALSDQLEISVRSVQRYIETLRVAGEWLEYDSGLKGWKLSVGKSVLWGDF